MNKNKLLNSIKKGLPIAKKLESQLYMIEDSLVRYIIGILFMSIPLFSVVMVILKEAIFQYSFNLVNLFFVTIAFLSVTCLLELFRLGYESIGKQFMIYLYRKKIVSTLTEFEKETGLDMRYCNPEVLKSFRKYLRNDSAKSLRRCNTLYKQEFGDIETLIDVDEYFPDRKMANS